MTSGVASAPLSQVDTPLLAVALAQGSAVPPPSPTSTARRAVS